MSKVTAFFKEVKGRITGDKALVVAGRNERIALSEIDVQLAGLKHQRIKQERAVEEAEESLASAKYPTEIIENSGSYYQKIASAYQIVQNLKQELKDTEDSIKFATELKAEFEAPAKED